MASDNEEAAAAAAQRECEKQEKRHRDACEAERARFEQLAKDNDLLRAELDRLKAAGGVLNADQGEGARGGVVRDDKASVPSVASSTLSPDQLLGLLQGIETTMEGLRTVIGTGQASGSSRPSVPAAMSDRKAAKDVLKGKLRALNVRATDMAQELDAFFRHMETYFKVSNLADMADMEQDAERVLILEGTMGEGCIQAMTSMAEDKKKRPRTRSTRKQFVHASSQGMILFILWWSSYSALCCHLSRQRITLPVYGAMSNVLQIFLWSGTSVSSSSCYALLMPALLFVIFLWRNNRPRSSMPSASVNNTRRGNNRNRLPPSSWKRCRPPGWPLRWTT
jgi:hypothetical protein